MGMSAVMRHVFLTSAYEGEQLQVAVDSLSVRFHLRTVWREK